MTLLKFGLTAVAVAASVSLYNLLRHRFSNPLGFVLSSSLVLSDPDIDRCDSCDASHQASRALVTANAWLLMYRREEDTDVPKISSSHIKSHHSVSMPTLASFQFTCRSERKESALPSI